jgi:DNA-binding GntR family transcriptional regulator
VKKRDASSSQPLYLQVADLVREAIQEGEFGPGDLLPTRDFMCEHFGVSHVTVETAMRSLRVEGLVVSRMGKGVFVAGDPEVLDKPASRKPPERDLAAELDDLRARVEELEGMLTRSTRG